MFVEPTFVAFFFLLGVGKHKQMKQIRLILALLAILPLVIASCQKEPLVVAKTPEMKDLVVPGGFNFSMTKTIEISVQLPGTVSYSSSNRIIEIWTVSDESKSDKLIKTGSADHNGFFRQSITVPCSAVKLLTCCFAGWRSITIKGSGAKPDNGVFVVDYNTGYGNTYPKLLHGNPIEPDNSSSFGKPLLKSGFDGVLNNGNFSDNSLGKMDTWSSPIEADGIWYATDGAKSNGSILTVEGNGFARINSEKYITGGFTQLVPASPGQIVSFSGDTRGFDSQKDVYLYLIPRNQHGDVITAYSFIITNPGINWVNGTVAGTMPEETAGCQILFFKGSTGIVDFDNAVVQISEPGHDRDLDGVIDGEDIYPDEPGMAFDDYYPGKNRPGTLAFEDSWPLQDDYDFNDLILDYQFNRISNAKNQVVAIELITQVRAIGGRTHNGFGLQIGLTPDKIAGIESEYNFTHDSILLNSNGTEMNQKLSTFILFADAYKLISIPGDGSPTINTTMGYHFIMPSEKKFRILLKESVDPITVNPSQMNPFIFRTNERSQEIHLSGFSPTDLMNTSLFGTGQDVSDPAAGVYYQTKNGLPWMINVPVQFDYTIEKTEILKGFPYFGAWASSGGHEKNDWYLDKQGYRDWNCIYRW